MNANKINKLQSLADEKGCTLALAQYCGPKQTTVAYMLTGLWDAILDADEDGDPLDYELTMWAKKCVSCGTSEWFYANPDAPVTFQWPLVPMGRCNERLHSLWAMLKRQYARMCDMVDDAEKTAKAIKDFENVHGSTRPSLDQQNYVALAIAEKARWRAYGISRSRR